MTTIHDLDPYPLSSVADLRAVGWIGRGVSHPSGPVSKVFFDQLLAMCADPWQPFVSPGVHRCELCQHNQPMFTGLLFVPGQGCIYVAPLGISHYVAAHWYRPPEVFIEAVDASPPMNSLAYKKAILNNGGRALVGEGRTTSAASTF